MSSHTHTKCIAAFAIFDSSAATRSPAAKSTEKSAFCAGGGNISFASRAVTLSKRTQPPRTDAEKRRYFGRIRWFQSPNRLALQGGAQCAFRLPNRKVPSLPNSTQGRSRAPQASLQCAEPPCFSAFASADYEYFHFRSRVFKRS